MIQLATIFFLVMPLVASIICIVKHPIWVGITGIIGWIIMCALIVVSKTNSQSNVISNSKITITNDRENAENSSIIQQSFIKKD